LEQDRLGNYELLERLGNGSTGVVWKARDLRENRVVALKRLHPDLARDPTFKARFERVFAARLPSGRWEDIDGRSYLVRWWVDGRDLRSVIGDRPLSPRRALHILDQVADVLDEAHAEEVVHGDVKPSHVLVDRYDVAHLIDFGIRRSIVDSDRGPTGPEHRFDGLRYVAPERYAQDVEAPANDVFALACVLYEAMTGSAAFPNGTQPGPQGLPRPPRASAANPAVPEALNGVLGTGMANEPDARYPTPSGFTNAAKTALDNYDRRVEKQRKVDAERERRERVAEKRAGQEPVNKKREQTAATSSSRAREKPIAKPGRSSTTSAPRASRSTTTGKNRGLRVLAWGAGLVAAGLVAVWIFVPRGADPSIGVGAGPKAIAVDGNGSLAYVAGSGSDGLSVVSLAARGIVATIPVGHTPDAVAITPDQRTAYVTNTGSDTVSVVDLMTRTVAATIKVGREPTDVAVGRDGSLVFVSNGKEGSVSVIDTAKRSVVAAVEISQAWGDSLSGIAVSPDQRRVYVAVTSFFGQDRLEIVDVTDGNRISVPVGEAPQGVAVSQDGARAYVANRTSGTLSIVDTGNAAEMTAVPVGKEPGQVVLAPDGRSVYVVDTGSGTISVVDTVTNLVTGGLDAGAAPSAMALVPGRRQALVAHADANSVTVVDLG
jgi:serine/threonine-protein kinase